MDIIYHGNCMDGVFSSFSMFIFLNLLKYKFKENYKADLNFLFQKFISKQPIAPSDVEIDSKNPLIQKNQQFFLYDKENKFMSILPGNFNNGLINYLKKSLNNQYVCLVDCYGDKTEYIESLCNQYKHVFIIDHHISGLDYLNKVKNTNITKVFNEDMCGFQLVLLFLQNNFHFKTMCPQKFYQWLEVFRSFIRKNDLKLNQTVQSKQFILGFYHFGYNMNDNNFQIYKQLANLNIDYILDKGKKLYPYHRSKLLQYSSNASQIEFRHKNIQYRFIGIKMSEPQYISDLGIILSELACKKGLNNLAMFYKYVGDVVKVSFRSRRGKDNPLALKMAQFFGGGGHLCAAGCQIKKSFFTSNFGFRALKNEVQPKIQQLLFAGQ